MTDTLETVAPAFVEMAHRIVWATTGRPTTTPQSPGFGILRIEPTRLRVMDGSRMAGGQGRLLIWNASAAG
jgi:hypothetical protein